MTARCYFRLKDYNIVESKVEESIPYALFRYFKHRDKFNVDDVDDREAMVEEIRKSIMTGLEEVVKWDQTE